MDLAPDHQEGTRLKRELEAASRISQAIFQFTEVDELVETALRTALDEVVAQAGSVLLADPESRQLIFQYSIGEKPVPRGTGIPWDKGIAGSVFQSGEPAIISGAKQGAHHFAGIDHATGLGAFDEFPLNHDSRVFNVQARFIFTLLYQC